MKLEKTKRKNYQLIITIIFVFFIGIIIGYTIFSNSYALYEEKKDFNVINGIMEDPGDIYFAYYIDDKISRKIPSQNIGYTLDEEKSNCNNGVIPTWDNAGWKFIGDYHNYNATDNTRTKCTLYFNKTSKTVSTVLGNIEVNSYTPDFTKSACDDESCESHEKGIYETTDYDGNPTYYYRGSVENNYVKFAGYYWRIIRINSNGSIRIIYDGTTAHENGESSTDRQYGTSKFNTSNNDNKYLGYMYTNDEAHGNNISSIIKTNIDQFYQDKLTDYYLSLDLDSGFCNERTSLNLLSGNGTGNIVTFTKGYLRVEESTPVLTCTNNDDYYTVLNSSVGNKKLSYPIGLISVDEVILAGHAGGIFNGIYNHTKLNKYSYLSTGNDFWTMTPAGGYNPFGLDSWYALIFRINSMGAFVDSSPSDSRSIRPVININSGMTITGSGTTTDPYQIN